MNLLRIIVITGFLIGGVYLFWRIAPRKSKLIVGQGQARFPTVSGYNLERKEFEFPRDFDQQLNLVIIPFQRYQQNTVNTWIPYLQEVENTFPGFIYYELPTIYEMPVFSRTMLNEGMRAGIPDQTSRQRTITLYLDKEQFKSSLDIPNEDTIYLYLVDHEGNILWSTTGAYSLAKANSLTSVIQVSQEN